MKIRIQLLALVLLLSSITFSSHAATRDMTREQMETRVIDIQHRVNEIKAMDFSSMSREQRKDLRTELKNTKSELKQMEPYIYISVGALLLIIIILILIL